ncbi:sugar porter family MFS transporter [Lentisphaerota bacterium ZTH]|nr:sugar porter family MFS transporter [Lentisphaerota bacterium]WET05237.1 sugar porter family MFS transporter [Lentisphaerota bacterium ZTH]
MSMNKNARKIIIRACIFAGLGGLLFGLDQGFINGSLSFIKEEMHLSLIQSQSFASIMHLGCIIGVLFSGWVSKTIGRKRTLVLTALFFGFFSLLGAFTHDVFVLYASRFALGLAVGYASFVVPLYFSEIAPAKMRGGFIAMYQLMITIGIFAIFLSNSVIGTYFQSWRLMLGVIALPSIVMFLGAMFIPQSPRWLVLRGREDHAKAVLSSIREHESHAEDELNEIKESLDTDTKQGGWKLLKESYFLRVLGLGILLMLLQQFSGINAVIYYSGEIFKKAGAQHPAMGTVVIGLINVIFTVVAIKYVDKWGRKPILYSGLTVMTLTLLIIGSLFKMQENGIVLGNFSSGLMVAACIVYIAAFAMSLGPIMWIICAEIFPLEGRDFGITVTTATCWVACAIVVQFSLSIIHHFGGSALFFLFAICCVLGFSIVRLFTPETKGVSLEHIEGKLKSGEKLLRIGRT